MSSWKSTIVRIKFTAVRTAFGTLERVAPALGARWAEHLWLRIPEHREIQERLPPGEAFTVTVAGQQVHGWVWGSGPVVYLVHDRGGTSAHLRGFVDPLLAEGCRVVTFDALSHGESEPGLLGPRHTSIPEMASALEAVAAVHGPAHAVIAHGLACNGTFFALRRGLRAERLVFLAPMTQPMPYTAVFGARLGFDERIRTRMIDRVARLLGQPLSAFDIPSQVMDMVPPPLLTVHDPNDRSTRYADSVAIVRIWPEARLHTVKGVGHWRLLHDADTVRRAVRFVTAASDRAAAS
jgi:pimeloyl-ACP methyl ester carboxylesterase